MPEVTPPPPGSRVRVRGEEWAVQRCLPLPMGGHAVYVQGVSELVRHHQAIFLTPIDKDLEPLKPEDTRLVPHPAQLARQSHHLLLHPTGNAQAVGADDADPQWAGAAGSSPG